MAIDYIALLCLSILFLVVACVKTTIDLMFLVDGSQSITKERFETVKDWIIKVASGFQIENQVQIGVVSVLLLSIILYNCFKCPTYVPIVLLITNSGTVFSLVQKQRIR